jgi:hypothetical protein
MEFKPEDINNALDVARAINDGDYLAHEEAVMSGDPEAVLSAQKNQIRVATTDQEIAALKEALKKALESNN